MTRNKILMSHAHSSLPVAGTPSLPEFIAGFTADLNELDQFYSISISPTRLLRHEQYLTLKMDELHTIDFENLDKNGQIDWLLSETFLGRKLDNIRFQWQRLPELDFFLDPWAQHLIDLCEWRQNVMIFSGEEAGRKMAAAVESITALTRKMEDRSIAKDPFTRRQAANRAAGVIDELHNRLDDFVKFYRGYDPAMTWWISRPWDDLSACMVTLAKSLRESIGTEEGSAGDIVGEPLGRKALLQEIRAEYLPYSPEELIEIGEEEFKWCQQQFAAVTRDLGLDDPKKALEQVKARFVDPGEQVHLVHALAKEAVSYVQDRDMITIPPIANECWQTHMMTPSDQRWAPFFLGGPEISVSYPTDTMSHGDKMMSMRGNNPAFSRSTVFHELLPGHHLQFHYMARFKSYRKIFETPFWMEGWALYWEMVLWNRGFPGEVSQKYAVNEAENKIGMLFWRMHRCARIIFSIKFHLGQMTPQECVDMLVEKVGHERATAEGEVRRSFNGDWSPLYQAGYMLGALQLMKLRRELVESGTHPWTEKQFHDRIMRENTMPIELLRALLAESSLSPRQESCWRFYDFGQ